MSSNAFLLLFARLMMSSLFVWDGVVQLRNPVGTARYFARVHVPAPDIADLDTGPSVWRSSAAREFLQPMGPLLCLPLSALGTAFGVHLPAGDQNNMIRF